VAPSFTLCPGAKHDIRSSQPIPALKSSSHHVVAHALKTQGGTVISSELWFFATTPLVCLRNIIEPLKRDP